METRRHSPARCLHTPCATRSPTCGYPATAAGCDSGHSPRA
ncbi:hypothetical protein OH491_11830 [Termitidicoccus mucosus]